MNLPAPFRGTLFESMFADAARVVADDLTTRLPAFKGSGSFRETVYLVMETYLAGVATGETQLYQSSTYDRPAITYCATRTGYDPDTIETILAEIEIDTFNGSIPAWFLDPHKTIADYTQTQNEIDALKPSFLQRVANTIFSPLGIDPANFGTYITIALVIAAVIAAAWVYRSFK